MWMLEPGIPKAVTTGAAIFFVSMLGAIPHDGDPPCEASARSLFHEMVHIGAITCNVFQLLDREDEHVYQTRW